METKSKLKHKNAPNRQKQMSSNDHNTSNSFSCAPINRWQVNGNKIGVGGYYYITAYLQGAHKTTHCQHNFSPLSSCSGAFNHIALSSSAELAQLSS